MTIIETNLPTNGNFTRRTTTDEIILHHAEAKHASVEEVNRWHLERGWTGIGYHFYIRKDGKVYRGRPEWAVGAHAMGHNGRAIGICCEGAYMTETMPAAQLDALKALIRQLMGKYPGARLMRHCDVNSTDCPGKNFPWAEVQKYGAVTTTKKEETMTYEAFKAMMQRYEQERAALPPHDYAEQAWKAMQDAGITDGTKPRSPLTREQFAVLCRRLGLIGKGAQ